MNFSLKPLKLNIYIALLVKMAFVLFIYLFSRWIFFQINASYFPGITAGNWATIYWGGLHFDVAALLYTNALYIVMQTFPLPIRFKNWYQKIGSFVFLFSNGLAFLVNTIDFIYFRFTLRRSTFSVFAEFKNEQQKGKFLFTFLADYWYLLILFLFLFFLLWWINKKIAIKEPVIKNPWLYYPTGVGILVLTVVLSVGGIRGDLQHSTRPITMSNAGDYVQNSSQIPLVLNTPFCMVRTIKQKFYSPINFYSPAEVEKIYNPLQQLSSNKPFNNKNVVILILESFGKDAMGYYNKDLQNGTYKGFTPFLDSLAAVSYTSSRSFANGRKSIEALPSILAGIPTGEVPFILTPYAQDKIKSLPYILKKYGYSASFFHGAANGSMGFKAILKLMGVDNYFGRTEYNNDEDFDGLWGIWDEPFFQFFAKNLDTMKQPFISTIFSVSSHHPFIIPEKYIGKFPKGDLPIYECIAYTDMALRKFFKTASAMPWFKNTLFVISADHASVSQFPEYQNSLGDLSIPILFYSPGDTLLARHTGEVIQQTDIMPSILSYLNYNGNIIAFGKNIFDSSHADVASNYMNTYRRIEGDYVLEADAHSIFGLYNYIKDRKMLVNLKDKMPSKANEMYVNLKAYIQQYNNRLLQDKLWPGEK